MADFLLEIGTEEIPARMVVGATDELTRRVRDLLTRERLASEPAVESFSTPRRLAVLARGVAASQPDVEEQVMGPSAKVAYKDGQPTPAAQAFAKKVNLDVSKLQTVTTPKGEYLAATVKKTGRPASELFAEFLPKELAGIYWAKNMYWREGKPERFVRPIRWLVAMLDSEVVPLEFGGVKAGKSSRGHRILGTLSESLRAPHLPSSGRCGHDEPLTIPNADSYAETMKSGHVIPTYAEREHRIRKALDAATRTVSGARWREDKDLLATVVNLTEYPSVILGNFDREYLTLPEEVLVTVMRDHQKYFAVEDENGKLAPHFLAVLNTEVDAEGQAIIRHGNERVLRARFNDARFFWNTDQKHHLRDRVDSLKNVTFQKDLGSYFDKTVRVQKLASLVSETLKDSGIAVRPGIVHKAALMAKTDLTTELVKEFTELQGIIGGLYAKHQLAETNQANPGPIGDAIYDQYKPESTDDDIPRTTEGAILAIADKADSIAGMFALGLIPSGSKDPFALRRAANGIVRIAAEKKFELDLGALFKNAREEYRNSEAERRFKISLTVSEVQPSEGPNRKRRTAPKVLSTSFEESPERFEELLFWALESFILDRFAFYLRDVHKYAYDVVNAVLVNSRLDIVDVMARANAVARVKGTDEFAAIAIASKRSANIVDQAIREKKWDWEGEREFNFNAPDIPLEERQLADMVISIENSVRMYAQCKDYPAALSEIAKVSNPLAAFFEAVMVMVDDVSVRNRRLRLLMLLDDILNRVADFSEIVTEKK